MTRDTRQRTGKLFRLAFGDAPDWIMHHRCDGGMDIEQDAFKRF